MNQHALGINTFRSAGGGEERKQLSCSQVEGEEKSKIITDVLLEKINQLENKVKTLEEEKKKN